MPTRTPHGLIKPASGQEAANVLKIAGDLADSANSALPNFQTWTPVLTGPTAPLSSDCRHARVGDLLIATFDFEMTAGGSGTWSMTLPFDPRDPAREQLVGSFEYFSGSSRTFGAIILQNGDPEVYFVSDSGILYSGAGAASDWFTGTIHCEAADPLYA